MVNLQNEKQIILRYFDALASAKVEEIPEVCEAEVRGRVSGEGRPFFFCAASLLLPLGEIYCEIG